MVFRVSGLRESYSPFQGCPARFYTHLAALASFGMTQILRHFPRRSWTLAVRLEFVGAALGAILAFRAQQTCQDAQLSIAESIVFCHLCAYALTQPDTVVLRPMFSSRLVVGSGHAIGRMGRWAAHIYSHPEIAAKRRSLLHTRPDIRAFHPVARCIRTEKLLRPPSVRRRPRQICEFVMLATSVS